MTGPVPIAIEVSQDPETGLPRVGFALSDGGVVAVVLDPGHARAVARRLDAITSGAIAALPPSRRVLEIDLGRVDVTADTERPRAAGGAGR